MLEDVDKDDYPSNNENHPAYPIKFKVTAHDEKKTNIDTDKRYGYAKHAKGPYLPFVDSHLFSSPPPRFIFEYNAVST